MIKIAKGKDDVLLSEIAENHWRNLNPKYKPISIIYQKKGALAGRVIAHFEKKMAANLLNEAAFFKEFCDNDFALLQGCIKSPASSFRALINYVEGLLVKHNLSSEDSRKAILAEILILFNYELWRTNGGGYKLFIELGNKACVYCNLEDLKKDEINNLYIGTYDHFYDKAAYPYLSLALGNLLPSCYACNQTYKKTHFCTVSHVHPHVDDYNELCTIISDYAGDMDANHSVRMKPNFNPDNRRLLIDTDLQLDTRYNDEAILKQVVSIRSILDLHPQERVSELTKELGISTENAIKYICRKFDFPYYPYEILNVVYGKLKRDLAIQHHLIVNV